MSDTKVEFINKSVFLSNNLKTRPTEYIKYEYYLLKSHTSNELLERIKKSYTSILLSTLTQLPNEIIVQLENMGIYDTDDFFVINDKLANKLNLNSSDFKTINRYVINERIRNSEIPMLNLSIPENYAFFVSKEIGNEIRIGIYWRGIVFIFLSSLDHRNQLIKTVNVLIDKCKNPELISHYSDTMIKEIDNISLINTYCSNFPIEISLFDYTQKLQYVEISKSINFTNSLISELDRLLFVKDIADLVKQFILNQDLH